MVPEVIRLKESGVCVCGQLVTAGERAGWSRRTGHVVCLSCLGALSAPDEDLSTVYYEAPTPSQDDAALTPELPEPLAVVIPADWASPAPITLPGWQRSAGVDPTLPPAAPLPSPATVSAEVQRPGAEATTPHTEVVTALAAPAVTAPEDVAVVVEAVAMTVPSHRRRTLLPAGLLALRSSRGRQPGPTGQSDSSIRAVLDGVAGSGVQSLHDRRMPGRRGRLAHVAVGAGGVYVIDVVRAKHASVEVQGLDEPDPDRRELVVGGRPMTDAVIATRARVAIVRGLLDEVELTIVPTIGVVCFADTTVPSGTELTVAGVRVVDRTGLSALVVSDGALDDEHRETLLEYLGERLPA